MPKPDLTPVNLGSIARGLALGWVRTFWEEGRAGVLPK